MWSCFAELVNRKHVPQVWGRLDNSEWELFHMAMEKSHPIFRFAENGWKLDKLVQNNYPAWHLFHLDEGLNWKRKDSMTRLPQKRNPKKRKSEEDPTEPQEHQKLQRGDIYWPNITVMIHLHSRRISRISKS